MTDDDDIDDTDTDDNNLDTDDTSDESTEVAMSTAKPKRVRKPKPRTKAHAKAKKPAARTAHAKHAKGKPGDAPLTKGRLQLPRQARKAQETFRVTEDERNQLVSQAMKEGATSMSNFYRGKLGLSEV